MDAFARFKASIVDAVERLDFLAECRRLTTDAEGAAGAAGATPPGPALDARTVDGLARLVLDLTTALSTHGAAGAGPVVLARRLCDDVVAAAAAVRDDANGDEWRRLRPCIVERLGELERAESELNAPRRAALEALRASRLLPPLAPAPPPGPASASPSPATPAPVSPSPVPPVPVPSAPPPKPKPTTPGVEAVKPPPAPPPAARDSKPASTDDERLAGIVRRLSDNARSMLRLLLVHKASCRASLVTLDYIREELNVHIDAVRVARRVIGNVTPSLLETVAGNKGGVWLTPTGERVASLIPPETCFQAGLAKGVTKSTNKHEKKHQ